MRREIIAKIALQVLETLARRWAWAVHGEFSENLVENIEHQHNFWAGRFGNDEKTTTLLPLVTLPSELLFIP